MSLEQRTKKELVQIIQELKEKVKELAAIEKQQTASLEDLKSHAIGLQKDKATGKYSLVKIKYDTEKNAAAIEKVEKLNSTDPAIAHYNINKIVSEVIMRKARGGKYDK